MQRADIFWQGLTMAAEIISQISDLARDAEIEMGVFGVIGALSQAELSYYDQDSLQYGRILIRRTCRACLLLGKYIRER